VRSFEHGRQLCACIQRRVGETGDAAQVADLIVSDVEMPQMDGLHLTRNIKEHPQLRELPVVLYSSILTPDNLKKGKAVGADAQITKPDLSKLVELADQLALGRQPRSEEPPPRQTELAAAPAGESAACLT